MLNKTTTNKNIMKTFKVSAIVKGIETIINVEAHSKEDARQAARNQLGYEIRGKFFPLHCSELTGSEEIK